MEYFVSDLSNEKYPISERILGRSIRPSLLKYIIESHPNFDDQHQISLEELNVFREKYIADYLAQEFGQLTELEQNVLVSINDKKIITDQLEEDENQTLTFGQRIADKVASFGGSWTFIISFGFFLLLWIVTNTVFLFNQGFDPYPFILLNLILSCIAALQAPVIMMSQNRQEEKDRERAKKDYMINLKAELEIKALHEKLDHLIMHQQQQLLEIQQDQIGMMNDILNKLNKH